MWNRFKLYRADGNLMPLLDGLSELLSRAERIEAKAERLLGHEEQRPTATTAAQRRYVLSVPTAPAGLRTNDAPSELDLVVDWSMFVPRILAQKGFGGYESSSMPHFLAALAGAPAGPFLDVGLNIGPYALLARSLSDREVVGFEPTPDLARVARAIAANNGLEYTVEEVALGASDGTALLYLSDTTDSSNSLSSTFRPNSYTLRVPLMKLDTWVQNSGRAPAIVKIDTETTEPAVIEGARRTLAAARPWVFCEVLPGETAQPLQRLFSDLDYSWYHLSGEGELAARDTIEGDGSDFMWLFAPAPLGPEHWERAEAWRSALAKVGPGREIPLTS